MRYNECMSGKELKAVAYSRVSTLLGQDPEHQLVHIREFAKARGFQLVQEYVDKGISGARERRPSLDSLVADARRGKFKILIVSGIDRIARNTRHLLNLIHELQGYGVSVISLRENIDFTTPMGQATLAILGCLGTLEKNLIAERIKSALAAKKITAERTGSGWRCGRPVAVTPDLVAKVHQLRAQGLSIRRIEMDLAKAISRTSIVRVLNGYSPTVSKPSKNPKR